MRWLYFFKAIEDKRPGQIQWEKKTKLFPAECAKSGEQALFWIFCPTGLDKDGYKA